MTHIETKHVYVAWAVLGLTALAVAFNIPLLRYRLRIFTGDEATYFAMAQSFAFDHDIVYEQRDLYRVFRDFPNGPQGVFLKKGRGGRLYYAKSYVYSLAAAPFVRFFGPRGFLFLNVLLLWGAWGLAMTWGLRQGWQPAGAFGWSLFFIAGTVLPAYTVWFTPEIFNYAMVFIALALWFMPPAPGARERRLPVRDILAAAAGGLACVSKPPNIVLFLVAGVFFLVRRRWRRLFWTGAAGAACIALLFGYYLAATGDWNFQGGERKTFYGHFPLEHSGATFANLGVYHSTSRNYRSEYYIDAKTVLLDVVYYFIGRYGGIFWYFTPVLLALGQAIRRRAPKQWAALAGFFLVMMLFIVTQPNNYVGGGGTLGNRYFTSVYPWAWMMFTAIPVWSRWLLTGFVAAFFSGPILAAPFMSARFPWMYAQTGVHRLLPVEYTLLENLPSNTLPGALHIAFPDAARPDYFLYFLNDGFYLREGAGFWVRGGRSAEMVLKRQQPYRRMLITLTNGIQPGHQVELKVGRHRWRVVLKPRQRVTITVPSPGGHHIRDGWMLPITVRTTAGFVPAFMEPGNRDRRYLGVYVVITGTDGAAEGGDS